jgi:hypothetical protein
MVVRNLCRERLHDKELAAYCPLGGDWDNCYIGVLAAVAASSTFARAIAGNLGSASMAGRLFAVGLVR